MQRPHASGTGSLESKVCPDPQDAKSEVGILRADRARRETGSHAAPDRLGERGVSKVDVEILRPDRPVARHRIFKAAAWVKVENEMVGLLPHGQARSGEIAGRLGMSPRTLARKLAREGVTFAEVLRSLRSALATRYLADSTLRISQIAWLLGYTEVGSFTNAFQHWTGKSPSAARTRQRA